MKRGRLLPCNLITQRQDSSPPVCFISRDPRHFLPRPMQNLRWSPPETVYSMSQQSPPSTPPPYYRRASHDLMSQSLPININHFPNHSRRRRSSVYSGKSLSPPKNGKFYECQVCGKQYKHPSCLVKHRWEHTDAWKETQKLSISKHQQVQMLEAASVLVGFQEEDEETMFKADDMDM